MKPPDLMPAGERNRLLGRLETTIREAVRRHDTEHPVFSGCYDWHSSVHGHWALLRIDRVLGPGREGGRVAEASLTAEGLEAEADHLEQDPSFEMPYGRAWFLRLALEFERWARETDAERPRRLRPMAEDVAASLLAYWKEKPPTPETAEYASDAWALAQLWAFYRGTGDEEGKNRAGALIRSGFLESDASLDFAEDARRPEFFSRFGNWAYLVATACGPEEREAFLGEHPLGDEPLRPVEILGPAHHLGMNWSRAWALGALARTVKDGAERDRLVSAWRDHVRAGMDAHETHAGDYLAYGHWVAQFAVYALTDGR